MNLATLMEQFGSEDHCHSYLEHLRWPDGVRCPRCDSDKISRIKARRQFDCDGCRYQFSVRVGTVLQDSKLPLWKWFLATYLMVVSKKGISANQLKGMVGVSYKTAWFLCHRIRSAMEMEVPKLTGTVEADETYIGGQKRRVRKGTGGYPHNKTMVLGAIERGGNVHLRVDHGTPTKEVLHAFIAEAVDDTAEAIYTDGAAGYSGLGDENTIHETVAHWNGEYVRGDVHSNSIESAWSLFKRSIIGSYHQLSVKHLDSYLDEFEWRFNNRKNPYLFRDTIQAICNSDTLTYSDLVSD